MNRWAYKGKKMEAQFGINFYRDRKVGGQTSFFRNEENQVDTINYGVLINSKHIDIYGKTGFFGKRPMQSLGIVYNIKHQEIDGFFGLKTFSGLEKRGYINVIYDDIIGTSDHTIKTGTSFVAIDISQQADTLSQKRIELVPGIFAEYTYTGRRLTGVFGSRYDYHSIFGGQFSPRVHLKYLLSEMTDLRFTAGKGWRVPNFIIDNISLLASSKQWIAPSETKPEISWNIGGSLVHEMKIFERKATISLDFYHTRFENQLIIDRDETVNTVVFSNLKNSSFSNSFQTEFSFSPIKNLDIRLAYKFLDVESKYGNEMRQQVMIPRHRGFLNLAYRSRNKRWEYDFTCSIFSPSRLPIQRDMTNDTLLISDMKSRMYPMINAQITHVYKKFDFYIGGENLTNSVQKNPIIDAANPFSSKFDATDIFMPITGINIYVGIRYAIAKTKK
jgi:outer membrane receptor protein involved in Fe transport